MTSYTIFSIAYVLFLFGLIYAFFVMVINYLVVGMNPYIAAGSVSAQFITYWNLTLALVVALPLLFIITLAIWAYRRVNERRDGSYNV